MEGLCDNIAYNELGGNTSTHLCECQIDAGQCDLLMNSWWRRGRKQRKGGRERGVHYHERQTDKGKIETKLGSKRQADIMMDRQQEGRDVCVKGSQLWKRKEKMNERRGGPFNK